MTESLKSSNVQRILSESDRITIGEAGKNVMGKFLRDYPEQLPDGIILPETSARPLAHFLSPILEDASQKRKVAKPTIYFFKVLGQEDPIQTVNVMEASSGKTAEQALEEIRVKDQNSYEFYLPYVEGAARFRQLYKTRAEEISSDLKRKGIDNPSFVVFDDYASNVGSTIGEIRKAFDSNLPFYTLLSDDTRENFEQRSAQAGLYSDEQNFPDWEAVGFDYRASERAAIGVEKKLDSYALYASVYNGDDNSPFLSQEKNQKKVIQIRQEMKDIGLAVLQSLPKKA